VCQPASFIVTRERTLFDPDGDKYETILEANGLDDTTSTPDFVRTEMVPPNWDYSRPLKQWDFVVDQDYLPSWWNARWAEKECRKALKKWAKTHILRRGSGVCREGQTRIALGKSVLTEMTGGVARAYDRATIQKDLRRRQGNAN